MARKYDKGKIRWDLLPWRETEQVVKAFQHGADKYADWDWVGIKNKRSRYFSACMRHMMEWMKGNKVDNESGVSHLGHAIACLMILMWDDNDK
jgi:hypothetical protein